MLLEEDLAAWFATQGITTPFSYDNLPEDPSNASALSISGGLGLRLEYHTDTPTFSVLTRASGGDVARDNANAIDAAWLDAEGSFYIGDYWVVNTGRFGGPPAYAATDERNRVIRSATYFCEIER